MRKIAAIALVALLIGCSNTYVSTEVKLRNQAGEDARITAEVRYPTSAGEGAAMSIGVKFVNISSAAYENTYLFFKVGSELNEASFFSGFKVTDPDIEFTSGPEGDGFRFPGLPAGAAKTINLPVRAGNVGTYGAQMYVMAMTSNRGVVRNSSPIEIHTKVR